MLVVIVTMDRLPVVGMLYCHLVDVGWKNVYDIAVSFSLVFRLSGESPFQGNSDTETLALVTAAQWEFDEESFEGITDEAKNFISSLLNKDTR